jgi:hypothetical protein
VALCLCGEQGFSLFVHKQILSFTGCTQRNSRDHLRERPPQCTLEVEKYYEDSR